MSAIEFSRTHSYLAAAYLPAGDGISVPVFLNNGAERVKLLAHVDTGASHCLFERKQAELLDLDVEAGDPMAFRPATGRVEAFGHLVTIETLALRFEAVVYFFADERINKNLLGPLGWLDRIRLGLIDHDGVLYMVSYD
jgi:predicted aspartyl protease